MEKIFLLVAFILSILGVNAQSTTDEGVVINGVKWATCNVGKPGTFAANPEEAGMFYQWNRKIGWSATDPMINSNGETTWDNSNAIGTTWEKANDPSPSGWRVPTLIEIQTLFDANKVSNVGIIQGGVNGRKFTDKATGSFIFLPASNSRHYSDGILDGSDFGTYWSSTPNGNSQAYYLSFFVNDDYAAGWYDFYRSEGMSVRAVADILSLSSTTCTFEASGGTSSAINVTTNQSWSVSSSTSWLTTSVASGSNNGSFTVTATANTSTSSRKASVTVVTGEGITKIISVTQFSAATEGGVVINGVKWATCNVDKPGTFAVTPESFGMFYQWNRKIGWSTTDPMVNSNGDTMWDNSVPTGDTWDKSNDPSPAGWRVPTLAEIQTLLDANNVNNVWTTQNGVYGEKFTDKTTGNSIFLPAVGYRNNFEGGVLHGYIGSDSSGVYWSSTQDDNDNAYYLYGNISVGWDIYDRGAGQSIRSVADFSPSNITNVEFNEGKTPVAYYSIMGIQLQKEPQSGIYIIVYDNGTKEKIMRKP